MLLSYIVLTLGVIGGLILDYMAYFYALQHLATLPTPPHFDALGYGSAVTGITAGGGVGILAKKTTEPEGG